MAAIFVEIEPRSSINIEIPAGSVKLEMRSLKESPGIGSRFDLLSRIREAAAGSTFEEAMTTSLKLVSAEYTTRRWYVRCATFRKIKPLSSVSIAG